MNLKKDNTVLIAPIYFVIMILIAGLHRVLVMDGSTPDAIHYLDIAKNLLTGKGAVTYILNLNSAAIPAKGTFLQPLFPFVVAGFARFFDSTNFATLLLPARILSASLFFSSILIFTHIVKKQTNRTTASLFLALLTINYNFLKFPSRILTENLYLFLFSLIVWLLLSKHAERKTINIIALVALAVLLSFTRYVGFSIFGAIFVFMILKKTSVSKIIVFSTIALISITAVLIALLAYAGNPLLLRPDFSGNVFLFLLQIILQTIKVSVSFSFCALFWLPVLVTVIYITLENLKKKKAIFDRRFFQTDLHLLFTIYLAFYIITLFLMGTTVNISTGVSRFARVNVPVLALFWAGFFQACAGREQAARKIIVNVVLCCSVLVFCRQMIKYSSLYPQRIASFSIRKTELCAQEPKFTWLAANNIDQNDLVIGNRAFRYRYYFNCPVIESGYPEHPAIAYTNLKLFLQKHRQAIKDQGIENIYFIVDKTPAGKRGEDNPLARDLLTKNDSYSHSLSLVTDTQDALVYKWNDEK